MRIKVNYPDLYSTENIENNMNLRQVTDVKWVAVLMINRRTKIMDPNS